MYTETTATLLHTSLPCSKANILINHIGHACLADFSLVRVTSGQSNFLSSCIEGGSTPWMSPELLNPESFGLEKSYPTKESDCYALGMVVYEVLSGHHPFFPHGGPMVMMKVLNGERPRKPEGDEGNLFTNDIWEMLEHCWKHQPHSRISVKAVLYSLEGFPLPGNPDSTDGGNIGGDADNESDDTKSPSMFQPFHLKSKLTSDYPCGVPGPPVRQGSYIPIINKYRDLIFLLLFWACYFGFIWLLSHMSLVPYGLIWLLYHFSLLLFVSSFFSVLAQ